jgi:hypothetical protein
MGQKHHRHWCASICTVLCVGRTRQTWYDLIVPPTETFFFIMTLTQEDLNFYEDNFDSVMKFGMINTFDERQDRIRYRNIAQKIQEEIDSLQVEDQKRVPFTKEEIVPVLEEYLCSYTMNGQVKVFDRKLAASGIQTFRKNPVASVMGIHGQIAYYDQYNDVIAKSFDRTGQTLKEMLRQYNDMMSVDRFAVD